MIYDLINNLMCDCMRLMTKFLTLLQTHSQNIIIFNISSYCKRAFHYIFFWIVHEIINAIQFISDLRFKLN